MDPRLIYLFSTGREPEDKRDRIDSLTAAARMPGRRLPRWAREALLVA